MELDLEKQFADRAYQLLVSLVTPADCAGHHPHPDGRVNAAPFLFNVLGAQPPIVAFAPGNRDDTQGTHLRHQAREFVVNLVDETIAEAMNPMRRVAALSRK